MKLFSIYTDQTIVFKDKWFLRTLQDDWELNLVYIKDASKGNSDYLSEEWYYCIKTKIEILIEAIKNNWNDIIIWADIDIQFSRKCTGIIERSIPRKDIVFKYGMRKRQKLILDSWLSAAMKKPLHCFSLSLKLLLMIGNLRIKM